MGTRKLNAKKTKFTNDTVLGKKQRILDKLMQPVGTVLLFLVGLSGFWDIIRKKRA